MTTDRSPSTLRPLIWILALAPAVWFAAFWSFVIRARLALGQWPVPYNPDPKDLGFDLHYLAVAIGLPLSFSATVIVLLFPILYRREMKAMSTRLLLGAATAIATQLAIYVTAKHTPGKVFFAWFAD